MKRPPENSQGAIILSVSPIYALTLPRGAYLGRIAKFLLSLQFKNPYARPGNRVKQEPCGRIKITAGLRFIFTIGGRKMICYYIICFS